MIMKYKTFKTIYKNVYNKLYLVNIFIDKENVKEQVQKVLEDNGYQILNKKQQKKKEKEDKQDNWKQE